MSFSIVAAIDFETDPFRAGRVPKPFCACLDDGSQSRVFWGDDCAAQLVEFIIEYYQDEAENVVIYAHNGGKFDFHFLLEYLDPEIKIINGRIAECKIAGITFRDSYLILPLALKAHGKTDIDYDKMEKENREEHRAEIEAYIRDDCKYLLEWVNKFFDRFGQRLTLAGTTFAVMKKQFDYVIEKTSEHYDLKFREFYFGGRVQAFETGKFKGPLTYLDINSAYPEAMLHKHPHGDIYNEKLKLPSKAGGWFADIDAISYGCLPMRDDEQEKLIYPNDEKTRRYKATGWEIFAGLETGTLKIKKVHRVLVHLCTRDFTEYVHHFYKEKAEGKAEGDKDKETFAKLMLNAAYGKFGQDSREFEEYLLTETGQEIQGYEWEADVAGTHELHSKKTYKKLEDYLALEPEERKGERRPQFFNVATAASITGYVRAKIWRTVCSAKRPIYCDTDSIICESYDGDVGKELGQWKIECVVNTAWIGGRKMYALDTPDGWKVATKGFRASGPDLAHTIESGTIFEWDNIAPSFNIKKGPRFVQRKIKAEKLGQKFFKNN